MLSNITSFVSTVFRTATTSVVAIENIANAAEKQSRRLDVLSQSALEAEVFHLEESKEIAMQARSISNIRRKQELDRELSALGMDTSTVSKPSKSSTKALAA